jgi:hypothetical protein
MLGPTTLKYRYTRTDARLKKEREQIEVESVAMRAGERGEKGCLPHRSWLEGSYRGVLIHDCAPTQMGELPKSIISS